MSWAQVQTGGRCHDGSWWKFSSGCIKNGYTSPTPLCLDPLPSHLPSAPFSFLSCPLNIHFFLIILPASVASTLQSGLQISEFFASNQTSPISNSALKIYAMVFTSSMLSLPPISHTHTYTHTHTHTHRFLLLSIF